MSVTVKFEGGQALEAALRALGNNRQVALATRLALQEAAKPIRDTAIALAPEHDGFLKQAIKIGAGKGDDKDVLWVVVGIDQRLDPPTYKGRLTGTGVYRDPGVAGHSVIVEFGRPDVPPEPYMTPAWDQHSSLTPERVGKALWPQIERAAARLAKRAS